MTHPDEDRVRALFDATAGEASGPTLTKLSARAADIPTRAKRRGWLPRLLGPLVAVGVGAAAVTLATKDLDRGAPLASASVASLASEAVVAPAATTAVPSPSAAIAVSAATVDDELAGLEDWGWSGSGDGLLAPLDAPLEDAELDAWLDATASLTGGGG